MRLEAANTLEQAELIARLAQQCWPHQYIPIIGQAQVDYMLAKFQSAESIHEQISGGRSYEIIYGAEGEPLGYLGYDLGEDRLFLSKLYILPQHQRRGVGRWALLELCQRHPGLDIHLTVNKQNHNAINFYLQNGFVKSEPLVADIGQGYVMDDWKMIKKANRRS
jgi:ribosomal protein S18 acetylase RimI-like enzyme